MGGAVIFVMTISTIMTYLVQHYVLIPLDIAYMQTVTYILVIAFLVQVVEIVLKKVIKAVEGTDLEILLKESGLLR